MIKLAVIGLVLTAAPAQAMLECVYYDESVAEAVDVVQLDGAKIGSPDENGNCSISGHISRVFAGGLQVDGWLDSAAPCDNSQGIAGPVIYSNAEALAQAKVIELHLDAGGGIAGYGAGIVLLDGPTEAPAFKPMCGE